MLDISVIKYREKPIKHIKILKENNDSNLVNSKKTKIYEYYKCDFCGDEIRIDLKDNEKTGGLASFPHTLTMCGKLELALCNKCLKPAMKQFEK